MSQLKHTELPWAVRKMRGIGIFVHAPNVIIGRTIAGPYTREILSDEDYPEKEDDALLIALACNSHFDLVASAKELRAMITHGVFTHDLIKDEKACKICKRLRAIDEIILKAETLPAIEEKRGRLDDGIQL